MPKIYWGLDIISAAITTLIALALNIPWPGVLVFGYALMVCILWDLVMEN